MGKDYFKTFHVDGGTYEFGINFCIGKDLKKVVRFVNFKLETNSINASIFDVLGKYIFQQGYCPIIWLPKKPETPAEIGTASHEIFHAVCDCMRWAGIPLDQSSEEAYCHLIKYVTKKFYQNIK